MLTATIGSPAWTGVAPTTLKPRLKVQTYSLARHGGSFLTVEMLVLAAALLPAARGWESLGVLVLIASCQLFFHINDLGGSLVARENRQFWIVLLESVSVGFLASTLVFILFPVLVPRFELASAAAVMIVILPSLSRVLIHELIARGKCLEDVLIVGTGDLAGKLYHALGGNLAGEDLSIDFAELGPLLARVHVSRVVIAEWDPLNREKLAAALLDARLRGLQVADAVDFYEQLTGKIWLEGLLPQWLLYTRGFQDGRTRLAIKRAFDVTFALLLLLLASPLLALIAIAIKLDSRGPVLFKQDRVGLHGRTFAIYKFRSMREHAECDSEPTWTAEQDERVTRVGRLLRLFRLDEIPQAFNVLKGEMSMVGPRPERPCFVEWLRQTIPYYDLRHYLKPGITGWAQVMFTYGASVEDSYEKLQYDLYYAKHRSLRSDIGIFLRTIRTVLFGRGR